jgi:Arc/MetJ family transcription regulator
MYWRLLMRTTLELPDILINEAMEITNISTKTQVIKTALENLIQREKIKEIKKYAGKIDLNIDIVKMRAR